MAKIKIQYDGEFPCLCSGHLKVWLDDYMYDFGEYALNSGGNWGFANNFEDEFVNKGEWTFNMDNIPKNFPQEYIKPTLKVINREVEWGCCGGCL